MTKRTIPLIHCKSPTPSQEDTNCLTVGAFPAVSLAEARKKRDKARAQIAQKKLSPDFLIKSF